MTASERVKILRENLKLSQSNFGKSIDVTQSKIADIEIEKGRVTPEIAKKIEEVHKVNIRWTLYGEGEMFASLQGENSMMQGDVKVFKIKKGEKFLIEVEE